jgi:hypothetical protein
MAFGVPPSLTPTCGLQLALRFTFCEQVVIAIFYQAPMNMAFPLPQLADELGANNIGTRARRVLMPLVFAELPPTLAKPLEDLYGFFKV